MEAAVALAPAPRAVTIQTDGDLVAAVRRGDDRAFEELYARYSRRISSYIFGMVKDHARAEDLTQDVFMSALRRMRDTDRPIAFKPWIYEIGKRMGMSRPSVESTLFRARKRLTEEYEELVTGTRCTRIQSIITSAGTGLGARDRRRMARHLSYCQPCRRHAHAAGLGEMVP